MRRGVSLSLSTKLDTVLNLNIYDLYIHHSFKVLDIDNESKPNKYTLSKFSDDGQYYFLMFTSISNKEVYIHSSNDNCIIFMQFIIFFP